jgi:hypothetical protein
MVKRRRPPPLYPRSFLATADLARILPKVARKRGMTQSQLIRHALVEWLLYHHVKEAEKLREGTDDKLDGKPEKVDADGAGESIEGPPENPPAGE